MDSSIFREFIKALAATGALSLLVIYSMQLRHGLRGSRWITAIALVLVSAVALAGYFEFGWKRYGSFMNPHDFYHYYTGTKYAPEIGYHNQYAASLLADQEQKKVFDTTKAIRNLETHGYTATAEVFAAQDAIKGRFSPERWEDFKKDIAHFQGRVPDAKWQQMLRDKGYNGTPVWSMVTGVLTNTISTGNESGMKMLMALDPLILGAMFLFIWWAFGPWAALFALAFFGTNFVSSFVHIKGALLRMDWIVCLVISMCLLHMKHFKTAGIVLAYAAAARVFPAIFLFGIGALACWDLVATRRINRDYIGFFASFAIASLALVGLSYLYYGPALWQEFIAKIGVHNSDISTTRVGFKYIFLWPFESFGAKVAGFQENQGLWWQIQAGMLLVTFFAARKMKPYQALGLGFVPAFFLTAPTFYYYVMLIVPLMVFLPSAHRASHVLGAALLFAASIAGYILHFGWNLDFPLSFFLSCMYGTVCVYMTGLYLLPDRLLQSAGRTSLAGPSLLKPIAGVAYVAFIVGLFVVYRETPDRPMAAQTANAVTAPEPAAAPAETPEASVTDPAVAPGPPSAPENPRVPVPPGAPDAGPATPPALEPTARPKRPNDRAKRESIDPVADAPGSITIALVGDIMLSRNVAKDLETRNLDFNYPFAETASMLQAADIAFGNVECPISGNGEPLDKRYLFNAPPESIAGLTYAGFDIVSLANNHILDYGPVALDDTVRLLAGEGIGAAGITTGDAPQTPVLLERDGIRVAFLAYADHETPYAYAKEFLPFDTGPAKAKKESLARDIAALDTEADIIVVSMHWGIEYQEVPDERQIELGRFIIDEGADIVAGHHPHVQQDAEWYADGLIIYSMGNFVFDQWSRPATTESRLYTVTVTKDGPTLAQYRPLEIVQKDWQPRPVGPQYVRVNQPSLERANGRQ